MAERKSWWRFGRAAPTPAPVRVEPRVSAEGAAPSARAFKAARPGRLANGFLTGLSSSTRDELRRDIRGLIQHSRHGAQNVDYIRSYEMMVRRHVVGKQGITLQMDCREPDGRADRIANDLIETAWADWGRRGNATPCGRLSWWNIENIAATMIAREGNFLLRVFIGPAFGKYGFQVAPTSIDLLDLSYTEHLDGGRFVLSGIEFDEFARPLAYHLFTTHPAETIGAGLRERVRVPASKIVHVYRPSESNQDLGIPQTHTALRRLNMIGRYEEAALSAAHFGAAAMLFFKQESDDAPTDGATAPDLPDQIEAGTTAFLPPGVDIANYTPNYPDGEMPAFNKAMLRGGAAGLGVSYAGLTSDMEGANFSSLRDGRGEERDEWRMFQRDLFEGLHDPVFGQWLPVSMATRAVPLPPAKLDKFRAANWRPRSWASVNPKDDETAAEMQIKNRLRSPSQIAADRGEDYETTARAFAADLALLADLGIAVPQAMKEAPDPKQAPPPEPQAPAPDGTEQG